MKKQHEVKSKNRPEPDTIALSPQNLKVVKDMAKAWRTTAEQVLDKIVSDRLSQWGSGETI
jgi:hypothetical protein